MAITRRGRIVFDFKVVLSGPDYEGVVKELVQLTKKVAAGEKVDGMQLAMVKTALRDGPEEAVMLAIKSSASSFIRTQFSDTGLSVGNVAVRV